MNAVRREQFQQDPAYYLERVREGEAFVLVEGSTPIAELKPAVALGGQPRPPRPFGLCAGDFVTPDDFDAPLPDDLVAGFE